MSWIAMSDREYLLSVYQGNNDAVDLVLAIAEVSHAWDDMIDRDKSLDDARINRAFTLALLEIPKNPFYQKHCLELLPVMTAGALNWFTANKYEAQDDKEAHALAHVLRYGIADVALFVAYLIGGLDWAEQMAPDLRRRCQKDTLDNYLNEVGRKHAHT